MNAQTFAAKDSFTKEEVIQLVKEAMSLRAFDKFYNSDFEEWLGDREAIEEDHIDNQLHFLLF